MPEVDIILDIDTEKLPIADSTITEIRCIQTLEHCQNIIFIMNEFYRVCSDKARIFIVVPYATTPRFVQDPTHKTSFNEFTFKKYLANDEYVNQFSDYGLNTFFKIISQEIRGPEYNKLDLHIELEVNKWY